jgi:hypothetical protein
VYTCYRHIPGTKTPTQLKQSLYDTSQRKAWIDTNSLDDIKIEQAGINYFEHDMPKAKNES